MKKGYLFSFVLFFILGAIVFSSTASAYIDPSAMTYIVQIIVGIIIACGAAFGFYFKRLKRKLKKKDINHEEYEKQDDDEVIEEDEFDDCNLTEDDFANTTSKK